MSWVACPLLDRDAVAAVQPTLVVNRIETDHDGGQRVGKNAGQGGLSRERPSAQQQQPTAHPASLNRFGAEVH